MIARGPIDRDHFKRSHPICLSNQCQHFGPYNDDGDSGCLLLRELFNVCPSRIGQHLLHGGGCVNDPPLFPPASAD
ncbi:hypothetical protein [Neorhodopirellula pilleata]|uniref:Uncharacterized protein n=1 Tax=Neorhodopirellula pilleata TaxID=2714738 RepID=A0A5C5ZV73_9BACT|nr:hypothetical protein [Neorhodopirellula pilleata]TWT91415.1 hypothetical protein Pla100_52650 [Neorhodopirellula pilleata]TWT91464.1 hypothetical protein Pla100_53140 [Neorhodopirellula pilleata]